MVFHREQCLKCGGIFIHHFIAKLTAACVGKRILKITQHSMKLWWKLGGLVVDQSVHTLSACHVRLLTAMAAEFGAVYNRPRTLVTFSGIMALCFTMYLICWAPIVYQYCSILINKHLYAVYTEASLLRRWCVSRGATEGGGIMILENWSDGPRIWFVLKIDPRVSINMYVLSTR